ncbi:hypothetical protein RIF29_22223 [Crotalaria pallida]|uniref:Uncharacterized protein n=1 Tax=Crotalaria pallida TaxID=3830 RepID=A0AAN9FCZ7_CROPI
MEESTLRFVAKKHILECWIPSFNTNNKEIDKVKSRGSTRSLYRVTITEAEHMKDKEESFRAQAKVG